MVEGMLDVEELREKKRRLRVKTFTKNSTSLHCTSRWKFLIEISVGQYTLLVHFSVLPSTFSDFQAGKKSALHKFSSFLISVGKILLYLVPRNKGARP